MLSRITLSLGFLFTILLCTAGRFSLWHSDGFIISQTASALIALFCLIVGLIGAKGRFKSMRLSLSVCAFGLAFIFCTDLLTRPYNFFLNEYVRGEIVLAGLLAFLLLRHLSTPVFFGVTCLSSAILWWAFFKESSGRIILSDDHSTFLYRLMLLKENFPHIPFYNPYWNAGVDARDFFATGTLNVFLLLFPLIYSSSVPDVYNSIVCVILFVLPPLSMCGAGLFLGMPRRAVWIAGVLSVCTSLFWYRWGLKYGTMGFVCSSSLIPLNLALSWRLFEPRVTFARWHWPLFLVSLTCMLFWSPVGIVFLPVIGFGIFHLPKIWKRPHFKLFFFLLLLINLTWISIFWSVSNVSNFVNSTQASFTPVAREATPDIGVEAVVNIDAPVSVGKPITRQHREGLSMQGILASMHENFITFNPLLLCLCIPGLFLFRGQQRRLLFSLLGWLLILGLFGPVLKPQLELERMLVILALCACLPAAMVIEELLYSAQEKDCPLRIRLAAACTLGFFFTSPLAVGGILLNKSPEKYWFADPLVNEMSDLFKREAGEGRVLFSGFILHHLGEGHLAPMTFFSGKSLMASTFMHNQWRYRQIFPKSFMERGEEGIYDYLELHNISLVVAHERVRRDAFAAQPERYQLIWSGGRFQVYRRLQFANNYFLQGAGKIISQTSNSIEFEAHEPDVVLKFNYLPFLQSSDCTLSAMNPAPEVQFIQLKNCPLHKRIKISSVSTFKRVLGHYQQ